MVHAQKPDLVFQRNGRVHLNRRGCQFSRLLAVEECGSADSDCVDRVPTYSARLLATHSIRIFPLHFPLPCVTVCHQFPTRYTLFDGLFLFIQMLYVGCSCVTSLFSSRKSFKMPITISHVGVQTVHYFLTGKFGEPHQWGWLTACL